MFQANVISLCNILRDLIVQNPMYNNNNNDNKQQ